MLLAGHQPNYLPNLAYFAKMQQAGIFVLNTNLQFVRDREWHRRNKVPGPHGDIWLTVPVASHGRQLLKDVRVREDLGWQYRHWETLKCLYGRGAGAELLPEFERIYQRRWERLVDLNMALIQLMASLLEIKTQLVLDEETTGKKCEFVINVCRRHDASDYLAGVGGKVYMDRGYCDELNRAGIRHHYVERDLGILYPYSTIHYLLALGRQATQRLIREELWRLSGYQPQYFPRLHYFARMLDSDIFEFSDYLQFVKKHQYPLPDGSLKRGKSYQADTPLKGPDGVRWLTVPVQQQEKLPMNQTKVVADRAWVRKHVRTFEADYHRAPYVRRLAPQLTELLSQPYASVADLNMATTVWALAWILGKDKVPASQLQIATANRWLAGRHPFRLRRLVRMSETKVLPSETYADATDWIIDMCRQLGAREYYFGGTSAAAYMDFDRLREAGVQLVQQDWVGQLYTQQFSAHGFVSNLSILDLMANEEPARARMILQGTHAAVHA